MASARAFSTPGIASKELRLEWELPELRFPENRLTVLVFEGSVFVVVPMSFLCIGVLVTGSSCLLERPLQLAWFLNLVTRVFTPFP